MPKDFRARLGVMDDGLGLFRVFLAVVVASSSTLHCPGILLVLSAVIALVEGLLSLLVFPSVQNHTKQLNSILVIGNEDKGISRLTRLTETE